MLGVHVLTKFRREPRKIMVSFTFFVWSTLLYSCFLFSSTTSAYGSNHKEQTKRNLLRHRKSLESESGGIANEGDENSFGDEDSQSTLPGDQVGRFLHENDIKKVKKPIPSFEKISPESQEFTIGGKYISLKSKDLRPENVWAKDAKVTGEDDEEIPLELIGNLYRSRQNADVSMTLSNDGTLLEASLHDENGDETVVLVNSDSNLYADVKSDSSKMDSEKEDIIDPEEIDYVKPPPPPVPEPDDTNTRRERSLFPETSLQVSSSDIELSFSDHESEEEDNQRELRRACKNYRVIKIGVYVDSYFCQRGDGQKVDASRRAAQIVSKTSKSLERFCFKLEIVQMKVFCGTRGDIMRPYVEAANNICRVLDQFRAKVKDRHRKMPQGDVVHMLSGRKFSGGRCIGSAYLGGLCRTDGYQTAVNEMSEETHNANLLLHELGHNLNAEHQPDGAMASSLSCGDNCEYSRASKRQIKPFVNKASCVYSVAATTCSDNSSWENPKYSNCDGRGGDCTCQWLSTQSDNNRNYYCDPKYGFADECKKTCKLC